MVQGLTEFQSRWGAIPDLVRNEMRAEMEDIADDMVAQMYSRAPFLTGDLAGSIQWTWGDAPAGSLKLGSVSGREYGAMTLTIYAGDKDAFYARFQEFGTVKMAANPFFYPVWRANKRRIKARLSRAVRKAIRLA